MVNPPMTKSKVFEMLKGQSTGEERQHRGEYKAKIDVDTANKKRNTAGAL